MEVSYIFQEGQFNNMKILYSTGKTSVQKAPNTRLVSTVARTVTKGLHSLFETLFLTYCFSTFLSHFAWIRISHSRLSAEGL
jgi:hypothetical protein